MNQGLWIARKNYLCMLIRKVSDAQGFDEEETLKQHCSEVLSAYPGDRIEEAIECYEELVDLLKNYPEWRTM